MKEIYLQDRQGHQDLNSLKNCQTIKPGFRAVFNWLSRNQNQSNYIDQSQETITTQRTNENSKQIHVPALSAGKRVWPSSDWLVGYASF